MAKYKFLRSVVNPKTGFNVKKGEILKGFEGYKSKPNGGKMPGIWFVKNNHKQFVSKMTIGKVVIPVPTDIGVGTPKQTLGTPYSASNSPKQGTPINPNSPFDGDLYDSFEGEDDSYFDGNRMFFDNDSMSYFDDEDEY